MTQRPIDVWNVETFDKNLTAVLEKNADLIQAYMETDRQIFLAYDHYSGSDRPLARPDNAYATRFYDFQEMVGEQMRARVIRAFHYTRMTDDEIAILRRQGIHLSTPETLRARLDALVATGSLSREASCVLYDASPFHSDQLASRSHKFWMISHPLAIHDSGVEPLMSHWGGEVASMWMRDPGLLAQLATIGSARVIELAVPVSATNHSYSAGKAVVATFGRSRGCIPDKHAFDLYASQPLPPEAILDVHSNGEPNFIRMAQGYPAGFVDVSIARWKELTGEDD
ncbi:hypothetical protein EHI45_30970 [Rhizobium leguminosarum]|uniref:hypothetical protein n=1 Tax=Rhizobium leguminosarum TaxID=384 RepID=UPI000FEC24C0|nr:hypothetical protein [Rhizobium leguminosarum]RWX04969.1 hypothetical protein EHI45_30970 [Rhizobium leguminosarum]